MCMYKNRLISIDICQSIHLRHKNIFVKKNKMRWYCWLMFFAIAIFSTWAFPADGNGEEKNLLVLDNENGDITVESRVIDEEDEEEDDDDDEGIVEDGALDITDRGLGKHKNQKHQKHPKDKKDKKDEKDEKDKKDKKDKKEKDSDSSSSSEEDKDGKKLKKKKCVCFGKKPPQHKHKKPQKPTGKPKPSSSSTPAGSSSQRPGGPGGPGNQNQGGSNKDDDGQRA